MSASFSGLLISFEGIDGSGKSTQAHRVLDRLERMGANPLGVREPGGTDLSERLRALLLDPASRIGARGELLLFAAARAQLVDDVIRPALEAGRPVVCDRFFDSTTAYQGGGRQIADEGWLTAFHRFTTGGLVPDRTYVLDVPLDVAMARRPSAADRMEAAGEAFFERVIRAYRELARVEPERVRLLDGSIPADDLEEVVWADLEDLATQHDTPIGR